jgi:hypothetical protein
MQNQWALQKQILARYRELGIAGHLPAFQGNAPWALAALQDHDKKQSPGHAGDTAWIDSRDPLYTRVADAWLKQLIADFGTDHVWQMDAYFANGTSWGETPPLDAGVESVVACEWAGPFPNTYIEGCANGSSPCPSFASLAAAQAACGSMKYPDCTGVTVRKSGSVELRGGVKPIPVPVADAETSYTITNIFACRVLPPDPVWQARAEAAYGAIARADGPTARWVYQGYALKIGGTGLTPFSPAALSRLHGFTSVVPAGNFIIMDMDAHGNGQWKDWRGTWGVPYMWTALHTYGGSMSIKGNLSNVNNIPWAGPPFSTAPPGADPATVGVGVGYTPEGLDQNPTYYEVLQEAAFRSGPIRNITAWLVTRAHRRYGLVDGIDSRVAAAWADLGASGYAYDGPVLDPLGVGILPGAIQPLVGFRNLNTPSAGLCLEWRAWGSLVDAASIVATPFPEPFSYDLVNIGREVLAHLSTPLSVNFSKAMAEPTLDVGRLNATAALYTTLLLDLDDLLGTDTAFMLGPWLAAARALGGNATDCTDTLIGDLHCADFMEWNARSQLTTWYPTINPNGSTPGQQGGRDMDYARKQWSGLIKGFYVARANIYLDQALLDAAGGHPFNIDTMKHREAEHTFAWQTSFNESVPTEPTGDPVAISTSLRAKYAVHFSMC